MISGGAASPAPSPPKSAPAQVPAIAVSIASKGEIFVGGERVADSELPRVLGALAARNKDSQLVVYADQGAAYARVVFVLDRAHQAGLTKIAIGTAPAPPAKPPVRAPGPSAPPAK